MSHSLLVCFSFCSTVYDHENIRNYKLWQFLHIHLEARVWILQGTCTSKAVFCHTYLFLEVNVFPSIFIELVAIYK